jgi:hypothetical protein
VAAWVSVALVIVGLTFLYVREREARVRETMIARAAFDTLVATMRSGREAAEQRHHRDSLAAAARIALADRDARNAEAAAGASRAAYRHLFDSVAVAFPEALEGLAGRLRAGWALVERQQDSALAAKEQQIRERDVRIADLEEARAQDLARLDVQFAECQRQLAHAVARVAPDLLGRVVSALPYVAGGLLVGRLLQ